VPASGPKTRRLCQYPALRALPAEGTTLVKGLIIEWTFVCFLLSCPKSLIGYPSGVEALESRSTHRGNDGVVVTILRLLMTARLRGFKSYLFFLL
jgi:hypothetical protein